MSARDTEAALLARCVAVAKGDIVSAQDQREANLFRLAGMVTQSRFPRHAARLIQAAESYFALYPDERLASVEAVRRGWVASLPRLRDMLEQRLT